MSIIRPNTRQFDRFAKRFLRKRGNCRRRSYTSGGALRTDKSNGRIVFNCLRYPTDAYRYIGSRTIRFAQIVRNRTWCNNFTNETSRALSFRFTSLIRLLLSSSSSESRFISIGPILNLTLILSIVRT